MQAADAFKKTQERFGTDADDKHHDELLKSAQDTTKPCWGTWYVMVYIKLFQARWKKKEDLRSAIVAVDKKWAELELSSDVLPLPLAAQLEAGRVCNAMPTPA